MAEPLVPSPHTPEAAVGDLAEFMTSSEPSAKLRIGVVTAVEASLGRKVRTDQTDDAWLNRSEDTSLAVGDRVWMLQQGSTFLVGGRLSGEPGAVPIGTIVPFAGSQPPPGWLICDGQPISRTTYAFLYALTGNGYGAGDGSTTFNIPDLEGRFPLGSSPSYFQTTTGGAATVALTTGELPAHTHGSAGVHGHAQRVTSGTGGSATRADNNGGATGGYADFAQGIDTQDAGTHTHDSVGSGQAHQNMPPYLTILYIIRVL